MGIVVREKTMTSLLLFIGLICLVSGCASSGTSPVPDQTQSTRIQSQQPDQARSTQSKQTDKVKTVESRAVASVKNGKTLVILPVTFKPGIRMNDVIREQCMLPEKLSGFVRDSATGQYETIIVDGDRAPAEADALEIQIIRLLAPKGGGWSGPKFVTVKGTLRRNGQVIGSFEGKRTSMGGAFGVFKGTCDILGRCTKTLGQDIATWLQNPKKNSTLGK